MVSAKEIDEQLKKIGFNPHGWGRTEVKELQNIILPDEEIYECVNGIYDGGFALLVGTDVRVLLIDKKPLNYLTVEDMRFDMINELDYNHRLLGAYISISAGNKNLKFTSINQPRLRKLIGHVQRSMAEVKKKQSSHQEGQIQHLEQINQQLQSYLMAQYQQQQKMQDQLENPTVQPVKPDSRLADYLYAQQLLADYQARTGQPVVQQAQAQPVAQPTATNPVAEDLYSEGKREIFSKAKIPVPNVVHNLEINPIRIVHAIFQHLPRRRRQRSLTETP